MTEQQAIVVHEAAEPLSVERAKSRFHALQRLMRETMTEKIDYGIIPGCDKPTLYKAGAEKVMTLFQLGLGEPEIEDLGTPGLGTSRIVHYRIRQPLVSLANGQILGYGLGECSSEEEKYRWRKAKPKEEYDDTPDNERRMKWRVKRDGSSYQEPQVRIDPATISNTLLKMAKIRSLKDVVLNVTAASSIFTQDIEDLPEEVRQATGSNGNAEEELRRPKAKSQKPPEKGAEGEAVPMASDAQIRRMWGILFKDAPDDEEKNARAHQLKARAQQTYGVENMKQIPKEHYDAICEDAKQIAAQKPVDGELV